MDNIKRILMYAYASFEKYFHSVMDEMEEHMRNEYKKYFAQDEAGWIRFYEEMVWHIKVGIILFPFICFLSNNDLPTFFIDFPFVDFDIRDLPPECIISLGHKPVSSYFPVYNFEMPKYIIGFDLEAVKSDIIGFDLSIGINWFLY